VARTKAGKVKSRSAGSTAKKGAARKPARSKAKPAGKASAKRGSAARPAAKKAAAKKPAAKKPAAKKAAARKSPPKKAVARKIVAKPAKKGAAAKPHAAKPATAKSRPAVAAPPKSAPAKPGPAPAKAQAAASSPGAGKPQAAVAPPIKSFVSVSHNGGSKGGAKAMSTAKSAIARRGKETQRVGESREHAPVDGKAFKSDFLNRQRAKLLAKKEEILKMYKRDLQSGQESNDSPTEDIVDRANNAYSRELAFSISDNERELMLQIDQAIARLDGGTYGYCLHTGMPIGIARLEAIPWAKYGVEAQEMLEKGLLSEA
jgi:DnaK suppressor protein